MFEQITALGYGIVVFAVVIGIGAVVIVQFEAAQCPSAYPFNATADGCRGLNGTALTDTTTIDNLQYMQTQIGSGGLAGWTPAIVALAIGLLFLGAFMVGKGGKGRY